jgi:hypothetical protein
VIGKVSLKNECEFGGFALILQFVIHLIKFRMIGHIDPWGGSDIM